MLIEATDGLRVVRNFLDDRQVGYWNRIMYYDGFWNRAETQNNVSAVDLLESEALQIDPLIPRNEALLIKKIRRFMSSTYGEDVATDHGIFLEKCSDSFEMQKHHDHLDSNNDLDFRNNGTRLPRVFNEFATLLYFNENYEGGELRFDKLDVTIKPEEGMLITFPCAMQYEHEVLPVVSGAPRLRMSKFWTRIRTLRIAAHNETFATKIRHSMRYLSSIFPEEA